MRMCVHMCVNAFYMIKRSRRGITSESPSLTSSKMYIPQKHGMYFLLPEAHCSWHRCLPLPLADKYRLGNCAEENPRVSTVSNIKRAVKGKIWLLSCIFPNRGLLLLEFESLRTSKCKVSEKHQLYLPRCGREKIRRGGMVRKCRKHSILHSMRQLRVL